MFNARKKCSPPARTLRAKTTNARVVNVFYGCCCSGYAGRLSSALSGVVSRERSHKNIRSGIETVTVYAAFASWNYRLVEKGKRIRRRGGADSETPSKLPTESMIQSRLMKTRLRNKIGFSISLESLHFFGSRTKLAMRTKNRMHQSFKKRELTILRDYFVYLKS